MEQPTCTLRAVFTEAVEFNDPALLALFLAEICQGDQGLRLRVERLLDAHAKAGGFLRDRSEATLGPLPQTGLQR